MEAAYVRLVVTVALVLVAAIGHGPLVEALANDHGICGISTNGLMACRPSVAAGKIAVPPPSTACCSALSGADMQCLCQFKTSYLLPSLGIDPILALRLPAQCKIATSIPCA